MAVWLVRAGRHGEYEQKFIDDNRIYLTWDGFAVDLMTLPNREALTEELNEYYPDSKPKTLINWASQLWPFAHDMAVGDVVVIPLKNQPAVQVGRVVGPYQFAASGPDPYFHWRAVEWLGEPVPRMHFGQDLLYSFGAFLTVCRIQRHNAEARLAAMAANGWKPEKVLGPIATPGAVDTGEESETDLELLGQDQIAQLISARFKGHNLTRLVDAILRAQGYSTWVSPEGADGGADILAGAGPLGFGSPRLCVEVKSEDTSIDRPTVDKLMGAITKFNASEGLFVAWGGYKSNVRKELASSFFRVRLWDRGDLLEQLFDTYDELDEDIRTELPMKRIWTIAVPNES